MSAKPAASLTMRRIRRHIRQQRRRRDRRYRLGDIMHFHKDEEGQAMTEFAIILPALLFLVFGILQLMLITNASYMLSLANFYALRTGVVHYELYQYRLETGNLENKMKEAAVETLLPILPRLFRDPVNYGLTVMLEVRGLSGIIINTRPNVGSSIATSDGTNWLECQTEMPYHLFVPFAGAIIASIHHWSRWGIDVSNRWFLGEGIMIREHPYSWGHPLWPYMWMKSLNYNFQTTRSPAGTSRQVQRHYMAIARRIYRTGNGRQNQ
ncbi:TadE/TadG family type IV pilus assembly protein [Candidatus Sumerlaeota bacterium]